MPAAHRVLFGTRRRVVRLVLRFGYISRLIYHMPIVTGSLFFTHYCAPSASPFAHSLSSVAIRKLGRLGEIGRIGGQQCKAGQRGEPLPGGKRLRGFRVIRNQSQVGSPVPGHRGCCARCIPARPGRDVLGRSGTAGRSYLHGVAVPGAGQSAHCSPRRSPLGEAALPGPQSYRPRPAGSGCQNGFRGSLIVQILYGQVDCVREDSHGHSYGGADPSAQEIHGAADVHAGRHGGPQMDPQS